MRFDPNDYVDVQERITQFWDTYPDGAIRTDLASPASSFTEVVFRAEIYKHRDHERPDSVGYAAEKPGNGANQTSWHENCETSAIGRALANMGAAKSRKDRPSKQEMQKVERAQQEMVSVPDAGGGFRRVPANSPAATEAARQDAAQMARQQDGGGPPMTDKQRGFLISLAKELGMVSDNGHHDAAALDAELKQFCGFTMETLTVGKAKEVIDEFVIRRDARRGQPSDEPHPKVQQAIDNREANWLAAIDGAATMGELQRIGAQIAEAGVKEGPLRVAYANRRDRLQEKALV